MEVYSFKSLIHEVVYYHLNVNCEKLDMYCNLKQSLNTTTKDYS